MEASMRSATQLERVATMDTSTARTSAPHDFRIHRYREAERVLWSQYGLRPTEYFVEVGSPRVRIRVVEVGSGPPLLFAHGTAGSGPAFAPLISELPNYRCIIFDRPGFGLSAPIHYSVESFGRTVADLQRDLLDALGIPSADIVGHSIGGLFALRLAQQHPERVRRIVLLGAGPIVDAAGVPPIIRIIASPLGALFVRLIGRPGATRAMLRGNGHGPSLGDGRIPAAWVEWRTSVSRDTDSMRNERAMVRAIVAGSRYRPGLTMTEPELGAIPHPALMLHGTREPVGGPSVWTYVMGAIPNGRLSIVDGAGHMVWLDEPVRVAREMQSFLTA
jgi:pimeloyl-ACP methyl ester carboxylesterase